MSYETLLELISLDLQIMVLIPIIWKSVRLMKTGKTDIFIPLFTFAMVSLLMSNLYASVNSTLNPGVRMPFAADEIAESSMLLLLCAGLEAAYLKKEKPVLKDLLSAVVFIGLNIALWIVWSGEWMQDIVFGIPYVYFMYLLLRAIHRTKAVSAKESILAGILCNGILIMQLIMLWMSDAAGRVIEVICQMLGYAVCVWFLWKSISVLRKEDAEDKALFLSFRVFLWTILMIYMSGGIFYGISVIMNTVTLPIMFAAVKRKGVQE